MTDRKTLQRHTARIFLSPTSATYRLVVPYHPKFLIDLKDKVHKSQRAWDGDNKWWVLSLTTYPLVKGMLGTYFESLEEARE